MDMLKLVLIELFKKLCNDGQYKQIWNIETHGFLI